jgi:hypothetical protein
MSVLCTSILGPSRRPLRGLLRMRMTERGIAMPMEAWIPLILRSAWKARLEGR